MKKRRGALGGALIVVIAVIVLVGFVLIKNYNSLVGEAQEVDGKWAQVQNVVKRRADLIPNLVNTVKGYASHEEDVLTKITEARSKVEKAKTPQELGKADAELSRAIGDINVVVEAYPELKANEGFLNLQSQLEGTENRIATERERYNEAVTGFNKKIKRFPTNLIGGILGFSPKEYFQVSEEDQNAPTVDFGK